MNQLMLFFLQKRLQVDRSLKNQEKQGGPRKNNQKLGTKGGPPTKNNQKQDTKEGPTKNNQKEGAIGLVTLTKIVKLLKLSLVFYAIVRT